MIIWYMGDLKGLFKVMQTQFYNRDRISEIWHTRCHDERLGRHCIGLNYLNIIWNATEVKLVSVFQDNLSDGGNWSSTGTCKLKQNPNIPSDGTVHVHGKHSFKYFLS